MASALVLRSDAQDVWKRSHAGKGADAFAWSPCGAGSRWKPLLVVSDLCHCAIFNWAESAPQHASAVRSE